MPQRRVRRNKKRRACLSFFKLILFFLLIGAIIFAFFGSDIWRNVQEWRHPLRYEEYIYHYSAKHDLDPYLVMAVIRAESSFASQAVSPVGARGLMQLMPNTESWLAERLGLEQTDAFNPAHNIRLGTYYLSMLLDMFGTLDTALAAYNAGMGNVGRWLEDPRYSDDGFNLHTIPFEETRNYVARVNRFWEIYRELYRQ